MSHHLDIFLPIQYSESMTDSYYCLDIGENLIKAVDAKQEGNIIDIKALAKIPGNALFYSTDAEKGINEQVKVLDTLISSLKIPKKNVAVVIPDSVTYSQILEMPRLNEKELISAIKYQADQFIPMPMEETNIDLEILNDNSKANNLLVLIVAAPKKLIEKVQRTVELAGLIPNSVENGLSATSRFLSAYYSQLFSKQQTNTLIVNLGYNSTSLYYYDLRKNLTIQTHTFTIGYSLFVKELQINLNIDPRKAADILSAYTGQQHISIPVDSILLPILKEFSTEIKRFITLIADKYKRSVESIYVTNDGFRLPYAPLYLKSSINIPIDFLNPYPVCKKTSEIEAQKNILPVYVAAIGGNFR